MNKLSPYLAAFVSGALVVVLIILGYAAYASRMTEPAPEPEPVAEEPVLLPPPPEPEPAKTINVTEVTVDWHDHYVPMDEDAFLRKFPIKDLLGYGGGAYATQEGEYSVLFPDSYSSENPGRIAEIGRIDTEALQGSVYEYIGEVHEMGSWFHRIFIIKSDDGGYYLETPNPGPWEESENGSSTTSKAHVFVYVSSYKTAFALSISEIPEPPERILPPAKLTLANGGVFYRVGSTVGLPPCIHCRYIPISELYEQAARASDGTWLYRKKFYFGYETSGFGTAVHGIDDTLYAIDNNRQAYAYISVIEPPVDTYARDEFGEEVYDVSYYDALKEADLRWLTDYTNDKEYTRGTTLGGCGGGTAYRLIAENELGSLTQVGTVNGDAIYLSNNYRDNALTKELYDMWHSYGYEGEKPSYEEFLNEFKVPFFVWKNALGHWVLHVPRDTIPTAECGKPVIYLYPERETNIRVELPRFINVTVSEPAYPSGGWHLTAKPNGQLTMKDGTEYGSLFWEGTGVSYEVPNEGFVVAKDNVSDFLANILPKYGLNEKETAEFIEFWIPELNKSKYYRLSFLTDKFDKAAPLNVTPRPDTTFRIFMDVKPLSRPIDIQEPAVKPFERRGFTLVEWGGLLYR